MTNLLETLNSLTDSTLAGDISPDPENLDAILGIGMASIRHRTSLISQGKDIVKSLITEYNQIVRKSPPTYAEAMFAESWRCIFINHKDVICNTLNDLPRGTKRARKICKKCQQKRTNEKSFLEELQESIAKT